MTPFPDRFRTLAASLAVEEHISAISRRSPARGGRGASVLVMISDQGSPDITYIERAPTMRKHAGQLAFPGGSIDPGDSGPVAAALREANEEIGLDPAEVHVLGLLRAAFLPASSYDVATVVGLWNGRAPIGAADPAEVADVYRFAIADLADPANRYTFRFAGHRGPAFVMGDLFLWGFSAWLTDAVLRLGGWFQDWDTSRERDVPERFSRR